MKNKDKRYLMEIAVKNATNDFIDRLYEKYHELASQERDRIVPNEKELRWAPMHPKDCFDGNKT